MTTPLYIPDVFPGGLANVMAETTWVQVTDARLECFMADEAFEYTYGSGRGVRTYKSGPYGSFVKFIQSYLNDRDDWDEPYDAGLYNVCFLNRYDNAQMQLGWHADDSPGMSHDHPIAVVSFGQPREIWWRENGQTGVIPTSQRQLLGDGSVFVMPKGFQRTHQHRIPKGDRVMETRLSLTFRHYVPRKSFVAGWTEAIKNL